MVKPNGGNSGNSENHLVRQLLLATLTLFCMGAAALAQGGMYADTSRTTSGGGRGDVWWSGSGTPDHIISNANNCAPDVATPVWNSNSALVGYSCDRSNEH